MSENVSDSFRQFVERSADPLLVHANMHPLYANPAFLRLVGLGSFEALVENGIEAVIAPHDRERVRANHAARMSGQRAPRTLDVDLLHRDGRCIAVESHVCAARSAFSKSPFFRPCSTASTLDGLSSKNMWIKSSRSSGSPSSVNEINSFRTS